jgi:hypothetical protein
MEHMPLHQAWGVLGEDFKTLLTRIKAQRDPKERVDAVGKALQKAKKIARKLMGQHHPDRGGSQHKFLEVQRAINSIEYHTEELAMNFKYKKPSKKVTKQNKIHIQVD